MTAADTHRTIDAIWRIESPQLVAGLTRIVRDIGVAEDCAASMTRNARERDLLLERAKACRTA